MRQIHHLSTNIEGLLRNYKGRQLNIFDNEDGTPMSDSDARTEIARLQELGHKLIGSDNCDGFDPFGGGCPGHDVKEEEAL